MKRKLLSFLALCLVCAMLALASCRRHHTHTTVVVGSGPSHGHGPPPHAPAHGYRHKHHAHGVEFVYDSAWGLYVVIGFTNHYYHEGHYYRRRETQWEAGVHIDGPWKVISHDALPRGLRVKQKGKSKPKQHPGRGRGVQKKER